jgi:hypothetical protein
MPIWFYKTILVLGCCSGSVLFYEGYTSEQPDWWDIGIGMANFLACFPSLLCSDRQLKMDLKEAGLSK